LACFLQTPQSTSNCSDLTSTLLESLFNYSLLKISKTETGPDSLNGKTFIFWALRSVWDLNSGLLKMFFC